MVLFAKSNSLLNRQSMSIKTLTFVAMLMLMFMSGYNEGRADNYLDCSSCTLSSSTWSSEYKFSHVKACTQGPNINQSCTFGVYYSTRTNYCKTPAAKEFKINKVYYAAPCSDNCFDGSMLTEATYWLLQDYYVVFKKENPTYQVNCIPVVQSVNASCFMNTNSSTYLVIDHDENTMTEVSPSNTFTTSTSTFSANSTTLTSLTLPCMNSGCCSVGYQICTDPEHGSQVIDVFVYPSTYTQITCESNTIGSGTFTCSPKCSDFANFQPMYKRNIKIEDENPKKTDKTILINTKDEILTIQLNNNFRGSFKLILFNSNSDLVYDKTIFKSAQIYSNEIPIQKLASGFYSLFIQQENGEVFYEKINILH
ncbi:MAG: hypothetical protein NTW25_13795 [Candidatus Kapabacteria bacterium]|nr:hypothetical protein [Candidatus Kapabacteria bacterium]